MLKRFCSLTAVIALSGLVVAGCGSSSSSSSSTSSSSPAAATKTAATTTAAPTTTAATTTSSTNVASNPTVVAAVAHCKAAINAAPQLSADAKTKLDGLCDQAAKGDPAALAKASAQVCQQIVKDTVPASAQATALASCPKG